MNKRTLLVTAIIIILIVMGFLLYRVAIEEFENQSSAPYPLAQVEIADAINPSPSQTITTPSTKFNVSPEFNITAPNYSRLPMYDFSSANSFTEEFAANLPQRLGLNTLSNRQDPILGKTITASNDTKNLVIYIDKGELTYTDLAPQQNDQNLRFGANPDLEVFKTEAERFIGSLGLKSISFQYTSHSYVVATTEHVEVASQSREANMIQLKYEARIEDLPLIDKESSLTPNTITIWLNSNGEVARLYYQATGTVGNSFGNYQLLDVDEIRENLQRADTKAKLVNGNYPIGEPIESINIMRGRIAYLSVENYLVPVYILEANVRVTGNRSGTGYLLLEAIKK